MGIFSGLFRSRDKPKDSYDSPSYSYFFGRTHAGKRVNDRTAMQIIAVYACVRVLSEAIAQLPLHVYQYTDNGKERVSKHPLYFLLHDQPNPEMTSFVFRETLMAHLLIYAALNCSKIIVTSGFRCSMHDRSVGGDGTGQHTNGNAADICCYGQDGQPISSKTVCCKVQDIGFSGIANITPAYIYTHVDVRSGKKWYGDEVQGNSSVTDNFYEYFGGEDMKGIDVSAHNGAIDWQKVRADGSSFAILRAGFGKLAKQRDERFEDNYAGAKAAGIPVGAYWYSYAMDEDEACQEADVFLSVIKGKQFEFPVYFDLEEKKQFDLGKGKVSAIMRAFLERVAAAGYFVGLYGSASSLVTHTADDIKSRYTIWLAHWCDQTNYSGAYSIWQHSEKGKVAGINGNVDLDIGYKDFSSIIRAKGLNGYGKEEVLPNPPAPAADDGITVEVTVDGKKYSGKLNKE